MIGNFKIGFEQGRASGQIFGSQISDLKIFQDRIGLDSSLKKCDRIGSEARFEKSRSDRFGART